MLLLPRSPGGLRHRHSLAIARQDSCDPDARSSHHGAPAAAVIDLSRTPSHGRDVALFLRKTKSTRHIPIVFVEGDTEKVERIKKLLPDAVYSTWRAIRGSVKRAIAKPPRHPVVPGSMMAGYAGTPLPKKLGIKEEMAVALAGAPQGFEKTLGALPEGVKVKRQVRGRCDMILWFTKSTRDLETRLERMKKAMGTKGRLWIIWPKKASALTSDLTQAVVRKTGLGAGLVDYKICAIDTTWSGLLFCKRKKTKP